MHRLLFLLPFLGRAFCNCPDGWESYHNRCYLISSGLQSFGSAHAICRTFGAGLASIETEAEDNFLLNKIREKHEPKAAYWIGGNDFEVEDRYKWIDTGAPFTFTKWASGQPDNNQYEDCIFMFMPTNGLWHDGSCEAPEHFICEKGNDEGFILG